MHHTRIKNCTSCKEVKPVSEFHVSTTRPNGTIVYQPRCKACYNTHYITKWHEQDAKTKSKEIFRRKHKYNSDWHKNQRLIKKYGINLEEFDAMYQQQAGRCAICDTGVSADKICVDHCHDSGQVRKLLCHNCNTMLGLAKENTRTLQRSIEYLKEHYDKFPKSSMA